MSEVTENVKVVPSSKDPSTYAAIVGFLAVVAGWMGLDATVIDQGTWAATLDQIVAGVSFLIVGIQRVFGKTVTTFFGK